MKMYSVSLGQVEIKPIAVIYKERISNRNALQSMMTNMKILLDSKMRDGLDDDDIDIKFSSKFVSFSLLAALALLI